MKNLTYVLLCLFLFGSCSESEVTLQYEETYCADPWDELEQTIDTTVQNVVELYLQEQCIAFESVSVMAENDAEGCLACSCLTGNIIYVTVHPDERDDLEEIGFSL